MAVRISRTGYALQVGCPKPKPEVTHVALVEAPPDNNCRRSRSLQGDFSAEVKASVPAFPDQAFDMQPVESSNVLAAGWRDGTLRVTFKSSGGVGMTHYEYDDVPKEMYELLLQAKSVGSFVHLNIKPIYKCRRID